MATTVALSLHESSAPSPLTMLLFGLTTGLFGLVQTGVGAIGAHLLGIVLFYGGSGLILLGIFDWRQHNPFGAVFAIAYGLFWLSLLGLMILPATGFGTAPAAAATASYLGVWSLFSAILFSAATPTGRRLQLGLGSLQISLLLLAAGVLGSAETARCAAGWFGLAAGLCAAYDGLERLCRAHKSDRTPPSPDAA